MPRRRYRIGLLVDGLEVPKWVRDLAEWAAAHPAIELAAVIVGAPGSSSLFEKMLGFERKLFCRGNEYGSYAKLHTLTDCAAETIDVEDLRKIARLKLGAIVRCGRVPDGPLADACRDGMISVRGGAQGDAFSEVLKGAATTPFTIERLHGKGEREVLFSGSVATTLLASWNLIALHARAFQYLRRTLERLASGTANPIAAALVVNQPPGLPSLLAYAHRTALRGIGKALRRGLGKEFNWQVAVARQGWTACRFGGATAIPNPSNAFLADPFTIKVDGITHLFVEEFPFDTRKGVISAYRLLDNRVERVGVVLEEPYHLSFPFVFEHGGETYMVPESGAGRSVKLYKSSSFPSGWTEVKTLLADVPAVDTVMFEHDRRWWMLTTIKGDGPGLNNAELHAFHADHPLGEWTPHRQNPIVMDAGKGRNGGFVRDRDGAPCRVAQLPGFTFYGAGSAVYRIDELTPETYRESLLEEVAPCFFPKLDGTHHLHCANELTVFDFMRVERPRASKSGWLARLRKRLDAPRGFEPRLTESESVVLPLDDGAAWEAAG